VWSREPYLPFLLWVFNFSANFYFIGFQLLTEYKPNANDYNATVLHNWRDLNLDHCIDKWIRPGTLDGIPSPRSIEMGQVYWHHWQDFTLPLRTRLAQLSILTPNNRQLANRLLTCIVENQIQGSGSRSNTAQILPGDVNKAIQRINQFDIQYPHGPNAAQVQEIAQRGQAAGAILHPFKSANVDRDYLNAAQLEDLLRYQHILVEYWSAQTSNEQPTCNYQ
jgi:hypothetical protein